MTPDCNIVDQVTVHLWPLTVFLSITWLLTYDPWLYFCQSRDCSLMIPDCIIVNHVTVHLWPLTNIVTWQHTYDPWPLTLLLSTSNSRRVFWHLRRGWNTKNGWGKSEQISDCLSKVTKLNTTDRGVRTLLPQVQKPLTQARGNSVLTPLFVVFNFATFDRQSGICSLFAHPFLVFHPRPKCQNTRRVTENLQF